MGVSGRQGVAGESGSVLEGAPVCGGGEERRRGACREGCMHSWLGTRRTDGVGARCCRCPRGECWRTRNAEYSLSQSREVHTCEGSSAW